MNKALKTIGILGGMGPLASVDLLHKMLSAVDAEGDCDYPRIILDCNSAIPDRTAAIVGNGEDPAPAMCESAHMLEAAGASCIAIACNTAHYWYDKIAASVSIPVLHMPKLTALHMRANGYKTVSLLATKGTYASRIYETAFAERKIRLLLPDADGQAMLMRLIYKGIKTNRQEVDFSPLCDVLRDMEAKGAQSHILGCTELPVAFSLMERTKGRCFCSVDPSAILAREAVRMSGAKLRGERCNGCFPPMQAKPHASRH